MFVEVIIVAVVVVVTVDAAEVEITEVFTTGKLVVSLPKVIEASFADVVAEEDSSVAPFEVVPVTVNVVSLAAEEVTSYEELVKEGLSEDISPLGVVPVTVTVVSLTATEVAYEELVKEGLSEGTVPLVAVIPVFVG